MEVDPRERRARVRFEPADEVGVARPALELVEQDQEEGTRVGAAVVGRVWTLAEHGELAEAQLVQDLAGLGVAEVVELDGLPGGQGEERRARELGTHGQRLVARDQAVPPEQRHEPGQASRWEALARHDLRIAAERGEVDDAAVVEPHEVVPVAVESGRISHPLVGLVAQLGQRALERRCRRTALRVGPAGLAVGTHLERQPALLVSRELEPAAEAFRRRLDALRRDDARLARERVTVSIAEPQLVLAGLATDRAVAHRAVLDLEQVGEVAVDLESELERDGLAAVVHHGELLDPGAAHQAAPHQRQGRIAPQGLSIRDEQELHGEILGVGGREGVELATIERQHPAADETRVVAEESVHAAGRRRDVPPAVADNEGRAVEDAEDALGHGSARLTRCAAGMMRACKVEEGCRCASRGRRAGPGVHSCRESSTPRT